MQTVEPDPSDHNRLDPDMPPPKSVPIRRTPSWLAWAALGSLLPPSDVRGGFRTSHSNHSKYKKRKKKHRGQKR